MIVSLIAAQAKNRVIGKSSSLPWYLPAELKYFRDKTRGHTVIMGRKTYDSIISYRGTPLPDRINIVITRAAEVNPPGPLLVHSIEEALQVAKNDDEVFVIGGEQIYDQALPFADRIYLTQIDANIPDGDAFFPKLSAEWRETWREAHKKDDKNKFDYTFTILEKSKPQSAL